MSNDYQDPYQQRQGDQAGYGRQGNQDQWSQQQNQQGGSGQQPGQGGRDQFGGVRQQAKQQMDQAIDQFANKIPGGQQYSQQAKDAADGVLNNLEGEAEKRVGGPGGLFGGRSQGDQGN